MARKVSRRKMPPREKHMVKEALKIEEGIFDMRTMMALEKVFTHNIVSKLDFMIAKGKEADIYLADPGTKIDAEVVILKIFRIETSSFTKRINYISGDPRFEKIKINPINVINTWAKKEYGNLKIAAIAGIHSPKPYYFKSNIIAMEFIGDDAVPAQTLKEAGTPDPDKTLNIIIEDIRKLYKNELVHGDVSQYNVLMKGTVPYLIDFGQAVVIRHPNAMDFLKRDVANILSFFKKQYGVVRDGEATFKYVIN